MRAVRGFVPRLIGDLGICFEASQGNGLMAASRDLEAKRTLPIVAVLLLAFVALDEAGES